MSWFRIHRPRQIHDLHLESVRSTLLALLAEGKIPQALLFAGPKGTGKTSASRIIAAILNAEHNAKAVEAIYLGVRANTPMALLEPDPDSELTRRICAGESFAVQEIDAASHGLVDDVRLLKERAALVPQEGRMAVYILDEVHMMSTAAFNALLKLLEEPPAHAVFILATTELHKVPATIVSRCAVVPFRKATTGELCQALEVILQKEQVSYQAADVQALAQAAEGSFRDAVKMLELSVVNHHLDTQQLTQITGGSYTGVVEQLLSSVIAKDEVHIIQILAELRSKQADQLRVIKTVLEQLHADLVTGYLQPAQAVRKPEVNRFILQNLLQASLTAPSPILLLPLEIALLELVSRAKQKKATSSTETLPQPSAILKTTQTSQSRPKKASTNSPKPVGTPQEEDEDEQLSEGDSSGNAVVIASVELPVGASTTPMVAATPASQLDPAELLAKWQDFLVAVGNKNSGLAALLRSSKPQFDSGKITIGVYYKFHQEQLQQTKFTAILSACCREIVGESLPFQFVLEEAKTQAAQLVAVATTTSPTTLAASTPPDGLAAIASEVLL